MFQLFAALTAVGGMLPAAVLQSGHIVNFPLKEERVDYRFTGSVFRSYAGGKTAPETRQAQTKGVYSVLITKSGMGWELTGVTKEFSGTSGNEPLTPSELGKAKGGKWSVSPIGTAPRYSWNGKPASPFVLGASTWPLSWAPIKPNAPLKIGDEVWVDFILPMQSILEDDPIGNANIKARLVFDGTTQGAIRCFRFNVRTDLPISVPIKHPEDSTLTLSGNLKLDGEIFVSREDGRVETSNIIYSIKLQLEGPKYEFGFSSAELIATSEFKRLR